MVFAGSIRARFFAYFKKDDDVKKLKRIVD